MDVETITRFMSNKTRSLSVKFNPDLMSIIDQVITEEKLASRQQFIDNAVLRYLEEKGKL